jgi:hypothetical protein
MTTVSTSTTQSSGRGGTPSRTAAKPAASFSAAAGAAVTVDLGAAARRTLAALVAPSSASGTDAIGQAEGGAVKSFDAMVADRTKALSERLSEALTRRGIPLDEPITLTLDSLGTVTTDSPYKTRIEKMFADDPELVKAFKDVASLNAMQAARKALDAFEQERRAAKDDDARDAAQGLYTARMVQSQALSDTMTLEDGKLRSASVAFMTKSLGEIAPPEVGTKAERATAQRVSLTV